LRDVAATAQALVNLNLTFFFDINTDGKQSKYLHSIVFFSEPDDKKDTYKNMWEGADLDLAGC
jgi:hypothetical protein